MFFPECHGSSLWDPTSTHQTSLLSFFLAHTTTPILRGHGNTTNTTTCLQCVSGEGIGKHPSLIYLQGVSDICIVLDTKWENVSYFYEDHVLEQSGKITESRAREAIASPEAQ